MTNVKPTVSRKDITVDERIEGTMLGGVFTPTYTSWSAELAGRLSSGERVALSRTDKTFSGALTALEGAIADLGWEMV